MLEGKKNNRRPAACVVLFDTMAKRELCIVMAHTMPPGHDGESQRAKEMEEVLVKLEREIRESSMPVIMCGDWNAPPGAPLELCLVGTNEQKKGIAHHVALQSAYAHRPPVYTAQDLTATFNKDGTKGKRIGALPAPGGWMDVFDFIYFFSESLLVQQTWREPAFEDTIQGQDPPIGIPTRAGSSPVYPSDHVAMASIFAWRG